ncbi:hypothetical protein LZ30DRAFT_57184 [Colletotrichum cereale]|nr:hypothetical protein LZ30DRAFT_57184 [Colletotrichum cereale]
MDQTYKLHMQGLSANGRVYSCCSLSPASATDARLMCHRHVPAAEGAGPRQTFLVVFSPSLSQLSMFHPTGYPKLCNSSESETEIVRHLVEIPGDWGVGSSSPRCEINRVQHAIPLPAHRWEIATTHIPPLLLPPQVSSGKRMGGTRGLGTGAG